MLRNVGLSVLAAALVGCTWTEYDLELTPDGDGLQRRLGIQRHVEEATPEELARLGSVYGVAPPASPKEQELEGRFRDRMPDDVGGHGTYMQWETSLGSASVYVERFRGNDDIAAEWQRRQAAADRVAELLTAWLAGEMQEDPRWPRLQAFLHDEFRRDLLNVSLYGWTAGLTPPDDSHPDPLARAVQYLVERDYFTYADLPSLQRAASDLSRQEPERMLACCRKMFSARMGAGSPQPELKFLATAESLQASLRGFLETTDEFRQREQAWQEERQRDPAAARPNALEILSDPLAALLPGLLGQGGDRLAIALNVPRSALLTNGLWSAEDARLRWTARPLNDSRLPPVLAYAVWEKPDSAAQQARFGKVVLEGQRLAEYCLWFHGLSEAERREWTEFLATLQPGNELEPKLQAFRFRSEPADRKEQERITAPAVQGILAGLKGDE